MQLFFGFVGLFNVMSCWPMGVILHFTGVERFELPSTGKAVAAIFINVRFGVWPSPENRELTGHPDVDYLVKRLPIRSGYVEDNAPGSDSWPESHHSAGSDRRLLPQQADQGASDHWRTAGASELCCRGIGQIQYRGEGGTITWGGRAGGGRTTIGLIAMPTVCFRICILFRENVSIPMLC